MIRRYYIIDRYIRKIILVNIAITMLVLVSLSSIVKLTDQLKKVGQGNYTAVNAVVYALFSIPKDIQIFFPMATLLGALIGIGNLARQNELIGMQASGLTRINIAFSIVKTAIPLALLTIAIGEWIVPKSEQFIRNYRSNAIFNSSFFSIKKGLWVKDKNSFIHIDQVIKKDELIGLVIFVFDKDNNLITLRHAELAKFDMDKKTWNLSNVQESRLDNLKKIKKLNITSAIWNTTLTPSKLEAVFLNPDTLSISKLFHYVNYLNYNGQDSRRYQFNMWNKIFQPIAIAAMLLTATSFILRLSRSTSVGIHMFIGIIFGFLFYIFNQIFGSLILIYKISPIIGAITPSIVLLLISLYSLSKF